MTSDQDPAAHDVIEPLLAEHALGALAREEVRRVDEHLETCPACRATFDELCAASAQLEISVHESLTASTAASMPAVPPTLAGDLFERARATPQEAPRTSTPPQPVRTRRRRARMQLLPSFAAIAVLASAVIVLIAHAGDDRDRISQLEQRLREARSDQVQVLDGDTFGADELTGGGSARARVVLDGDSLEFRDVSAPPRGRVWVVWQVDTDERIRRLGTLDGRGPAVSLPLLGIDGADLDRIMVTTEVADGTSREGTAIDDGPATV